MQNNVQEIDPVTDKFGDMKIVIINNKNYYVLKTKQGN